MTTMLNAWGSGTGKDSVGWVGGVFVHINIISWKNLLIIIDQSQSKIYCVALIRLLLKTVK